MAGSTLIDFSAPFGVDRLLELRTSRMKQMAGLNVYSGIDKTHCPGPMKLGKLGLEGDEHDLTFHGGVDKAILGYCSSHYPSWQESYPERSDRFVPGGFGENFVTEKMNERNVCIGDIISVGPEALIQVSLPRQPCFKLNHRFELKKFAPETTKTSRTGWYYRVLKEGTVDVGDELKLVERKWPEWTIERIQEYLHRNVDDDEMNEALGDIEALGDEAKGQFRTRVAKAKRRAQAKKGDDWSEFKVIRRTMQTPKIATLVLETMTADSQDESMSVVGAHAKIKLPNGLVRSYSIVAGGEDTFTLGKTFELGVVLDDNSRGGSRYIHDSIKVGDVIQVAKITKDITIPQASTHVFVVGGIGITAFLSMVERMLLVNWAFKMHYAVRSEEETPYRERLAALGADNVTFYDKSKGQRMDINDIIGTLPWNSHLYVCGPDRMMRAAQEAVATHCILPNDVHYEAFGADTSGDPFEAEITNRENKVVQVGEEETLLDVLRRNFGDDVASSCEVGNCGTCKVNLKSGRVDHRGTALMEEEKEGAMLSCVSRGIGRIAVEI